MKAMTRLQWTAVIVLAVLAIAAISYYVSIARFSGPQKPAEKHYINQKGSDTLLMLAQTWAEEYMKTHPDVQIAVSGGGTGTGIAALINKQIDIADASRPMESKEIDEARDSGVDPVEWKVCLDGISVLVNPSNPISQLTLDQLMGIYTGEVKNWKEVGGSDGTIITYGRQSTSGTYVYWQEHVLRKKDYRSDMQALNGNADIVEAVAKDRNGIGYVGVAYARQRSKDVKILGVQKDVNSPPVLPTKETVEDGSYPIARYLFIYTDGIPTGAVKDYIKWMLGPDGQAIVEKNEYIQLPADVAATQTEKIS